MKPKAVAKNSDKNLRAPHRATRAVVRAEGSAEVRALYTAFALFNRAHFRRRLAEPLVLVTQTGRALGDYIARDEHGLRSRIRIAPKVLARGQLFMLDVLLHEMVHAWMHEVEDAHESGYRGHGPLFASVCNRIGAKLGLPEVGVKGRDGLPDCSYWPMNVRPEGYYPEPFTAAKRESGSTESESDEGEGDEASDGLPVPGVRTLIGAAMAAKLLHDYIATWVPESKAERNDRINLQYTARYLDKLAERAPPPKPSADERQTEMFS